MSKVSNNKTLPFAPSFIQAWCNWPLTTHANLQFGSAIFIWHHHKAPVTLFLGRCLQNYHAQLSDLLQNILNKNQILGRVDPLPSKSLTTNKSFSQQVRNEGIFALYHLITITTTFQHNAFSEKCSCRILRHKSLCNLLYWSKFVFEWIHFTELSFESNKDFQFFRYFVLI